MKRFLARLIFAVVVFVVVPWAAVGVAQTNVGAWQPQAGVVLLRNGSVLMGQVQQSGDYYEVNFDDGELRVRTDEVAFIGPTLEACYQHQRQGVDYQKVEDHLALAEWCLRHKLYAAAGHELRDAMASDPTHPKIAILERRLLLTLEEPNGSPAGKSKPSYVARPEELDRMIRSMPAGTVETFTNVVQPLLLNQCSTSHCHGPTSTTSLRLLRVAAGKTQSRRATQRNLHSVLGTLDMTTPDASPLLTMPIRPHGTSAAAVFTSKQAFQYRQLVDWVYSVTPQAKKISPTHAAGNSNGWPTDTDTHKNKSRAVAALEKPQGKTALVKSGKAGNNASPTDAEIRAEAKKAAIAAAAEFGDESSVQPAGFADDAAPSHRGVHRVGQLPARSPAQRGAPLQEEASEDPFDPAEFNRQTGGN